ncbi:palmitoyl-acyl carrier protein thioesterase, chloroplastic-like isoform X2 [Salvia miltiorrhiza]|uniref:palmitoyl-acyl carrier protein thioesterase, chloroplastic-like isoform X2 n=1 Tax=Salvia miltiorrhiza TaxID=226208 RepID=UPI0025AC9CD3|nr:palmitoyl-acyl carrier protein thioesterase, chloroplastic-like isoform X2 [Salvia miltiorrhiza]
MASMQNAALRLREDCFGRVGPAGLSGGWRRRTCVKMKADVNMRTKKQGIQVALREKREAEANPEYLLGGFAEERFVYRQRFVIRSYEIGADKTATMETLMNLLQETALNHVSSAGVAGNGFGATREMSIRKLIWVVTRIHVQVDHYSSWGDVVEIDTWVDAAGKNGMRRDWIIRDYDTHTIITRATRETRRLSKIPDEVRKEVQPFYLNRAAIATHNSDSHKIEKLTDQTAHRIRNGLAPRWSDMDANQHVNNVKYIGWLLESVPVNVLEDYNMTRMTLEYRRECRQSNVLESLTSIKVNEEEEADSQVLECTHLLRMEADQAEIVRARSVWQFKQHHRDI